METQRLITSTFESFASERMAKSLEHITRCVEQLSDEQMRSRGGDHENSLLNLLAHLEGNIRQWILSGVAKQQHDRDRDAEFALDVQTRPSDALAALSVTIRDAREIIEGLSPARLMETLSGSLAGVQAIEGVAPLHLQHMPASQRLRAEQSETVLVTIAHTFSHLEYHTGQIVLLTKQMVAHDLDLTTPRRRQSYVEHSL